jgi:putative nucleotidyltransferase with HDIG domain
MADSRRVQLADEMLRRFASALRGAQLYAPTHPLVTRNVGALLETLTLLNASLPAITIGLVGDEIIMGDLPLPKTGSAMAGVMRKLRSQGVERITFGRGVTMDETLDLVRLFAGDPPKTGDEAERVVEVLQWFQLHADRFPHVSIGGLRIEKRLEVTAADMTTVRQVYGGAVAGAETLWKGAEAENSVDPAKAREVIGNLAQMIAQNRTALVALTALRNYDNYTFTHMVNVAILAMAQARTLGVDGPLLRELGLAALMHDIGKVRTPEEILKKPEKLTDEEFAIMRRHPIDGAAILRRTADIPPLAPAVAFEHHLRLDGTGYPVGVSRTPLNLGTQLATIADVYDAMRSQRRYQQAFPSERIMAVLEAEDHARFDRHLVRRFVQLLGIYPPGNLVKLNTGDIAVVLAAHAPDPFRPRVRVLLDPDGTRYDPAPAVNLWEASGAEGRASSVVAPVDAAAYDIDPLSFM